MKGTEVPNPRRSSACDCTCVLTRIDHCLVNNRSCHACQMCLVLFLLVQSLLTCFRSPLTRFADFVSLFPHYPSSDSKAFLRFIAFSGSPTAVHCCFPFFDAKSWPQSQIDLFTCTTVLHCAHTFLRPIALHCMHYGITLWAYLSEPLVKDNHKRSAENTIPRAPSHVITHYRYVRVTERYTETLHVKKMADLVAVSL